MFGYMWLLALLSPNIILFKRRGSSRRLKLKVTRKVKTCRQTKEEAGDARSDNETVVRGTQDGRFTENLVNISLTLALV